MDPEGKQLIDSFATTTDLRFSLKQWLPKESTAELRFSDQTGVVAEIL